jgi:hypothetical protein
MIYGFITQSAFNWMIVAEEGDGDVNTLPAIRPALHPMTTLRDAQGHVTGKSMRSALLESVTNLRKKLVQHLKAADINLDHPVELCRKPNGNIGVVNKHPNRRAIEGIFRRNRELGRIFFDVAGLSTLLRAAHRYARVDDDNPLNHPADAGSRLGDNHAYIDFRFTLSERSINLDFHEDRRHRMQTEKLTQSR